MTTMIGAMMRSMMDGDYPGEVTVMMMMSGDDDDDDG